MTRRKGITPLNSTALALYAVIEEVYSLEGSSPSYAEMMALTGLKSKSSVQYHLIRLATMGWINRLPNVDRGIVPIHYPRIHYRRKSTED